MSPRKSAKASTRLDAGHSRITFSVDEDSVEFIVSPFVWDCSVDYLLRMLSTESSLNKRLKKFRKSQKKRGTK